MEELKVYKDRGAPVAMDDDEYPSWLWRILDKKKIDRNVPNYKKLNWNYLKLTREKFSKPDLKRKKGSTDKLF